MWEDQVELTIEVYENIKNYIKCDVRALFFV